MKEQPALLEIGKAEVTRNFSGGRAGRKVALFGLGNMHAVAEQAAELLVAEGLDCAVINPRFTKPLDAGATEFFARAAEVVVTLEDHVLPDGYGAACVELFNEKRHYHAGGAHRLARPIHRARQHGGAFARRNTG